ncbi:S8 family serine peptidase, partial [Rhodoflexus caldus]|uniref:S8 family serine peptidase n=1 Tax=Rhodoflexus caldus TaxID=2891236 RepID=UPI00202AA71B
MIVKSAGNDGAVTGSNPAFGDGYNVLTTSSNSKNILVVANAQIVDFYAGPSSVVINPSSSRGPTDDGRIKPDITGAGTFIFSPTGDTNTSYATKTGTSMSGPNVSGSAGLLQQHWSNLFPSTPFRSATLRGLIIHTADEAGPAPGPDYTYGWGLMNTAKAATILSHVAASGSQHLLQQNVLNNGGSFSVNVVASGNEPLRFTVCWNDPAATPLSEPDLSNFDDPTSRLINDLDLRITDNVTSQVYYPWTMPYQLNPANKSVATQTALQTTDNNRDNVEQVVVFNPIPGRSYTVTLTHKGTLSGGSQEYAIIGSGIGGTPIASSGATNPADSRIDRVVFGTLDNSSATGCTGYTDFRTSVTPPQMGAGQTVNFSVTLGTCGANANKHVRIYVDWNGDGDFNDTGEMVAQSTAPVNGTGVATLNVSSVVVPTVVQEGGLATLRVVCVETSNVNDITPTGSYTKGETEDYLVRFTRPQNDVGVEEIILPSEIPCSGNIPVVVRIRNFGDNAVSNVPVQFTVNGGSPVTATLTGTLNPGAVRTLLVGTFAAVPATAYNIVAQTTLTGDGAPSNNSTTTSITTPAAPALTAASATASCTPGDPVTLTATVSGGSANVVHWFDQPTGGNRIAVGNNTTITSAVASALPNPNTVYAGLNDFSATGAGRINGINTSASYYSAFGKVFFNVTTPFRIASAKMYMFDNTGSTSFGNPIVGASIIFRVRSQATGQIVSTSIVQARQVPITGDFFPVNILFPAPGAYELTIEYPSHVFVYLDDSGIPAGFYPANLSTVGQITGNDWGADKYFWLYDMTLAGAGCSAGSRVPVTINISPAPVATITPAGSTVV